MKTPFLPPAFLERIEKILPATELPAFLNSLKLPRRKTLRVNFLKNSADEFQKTAAKKKWKLEKIPFSPGGFFVDRETRETPLGRDFSHAAGHFFLQESSSQIPPEVLFWRENWDEKNLKILDLCAAPGAKTTQIAAKMQNRGALFANEFSASRAKKLVFNLQRCGVSNAILTNFDGEKFARNCREKFDGILVDAPCSGEGLLRKDFSVLENFSEKRIGVAAKLQKKIAAAAVEILKPGGVLVYSTCTFAPEENEAVVKFLLEKFDGEIVLENLSEFLPDAPAILEFRGESFGREIAEKCLRIFPHKIDGEGFFIAKFRRKKLQVASGKSQDFQKNVVNDLQFEKINSDLSSRKTSVGGRRCAPEIGNGFGEQKNNSVNRAVNGVKNSETRKFDFLEKQNVFPEKISQKTKNVFPENSEGIYPGSGNNFAEQKLNSDLGYFSAKNSEATQKDVFPEKNSQNFLSGIRAANSDREKNQTPDNFSAKNFRGDTFGFRRKKVRETENFRPNFYQKISAAKFKILEKFAAEFEFKIEKLRPRLFGKSGKIFLFPENFTPENFGKFDRAGIFCGEIFDDRNFKIGENRGGENPVGKNLNPADSRFRGNDKSFSAGKISNSSFRPAAEFLQTFGKEFCGPQILRISKTETKKFFRGENLENVKISPDFVGKFFGVFCDQTPLGWAKLTEKNLKNLLPRNFICEIV